MIGFFPDPYPDELLYSACARYAQRTKYPNKQSVLAVLFGKKGVSAIVDFPTRLQYFISILPKNHNYSVKKLINENTLLPFYEPFLPSERVKTIREEMSKEGSNKIQIRIGTKAKQIESSKNLRYCPDCVKADRNQYGETYWHRIHQLGGILVCPKHKCFLINSFVGLGRFSGKMFHNAEESIPQITNEADYIDKRSKDHQMLLKVSKDAEWLLLNLSFDTDSKKIRDKYFNILLKQGYAYYNGRIKHNKLLSAIKSFFSTNLFESVGKVSESEDWLPALVDKGNINKVYHPVRHLLLMTFLGFSAKDFFTSFVEFKPFLSPPYPCLNISADHYKQFCIQECKIADNLTKNEKFRRPIALFNCECGFIYQRLGPDKSEKDKFRYSSIKEYGSVWEKKFAEYWADLSLSASEIGRYIGVSQTSVGRHAIRLNLPMNTKGTRSLEGYARHRNPKTSFSEMKENYRRTWLQIRLKYPDSTRKKLADTENFIYQWLKRNDRQWFEKNLPHAAKVCKKQDLLNWEKIDKDLSQKIISACQKIKESLNFPVRISITEIIRQVGHKKWIDKRQKKLPITTKVINENLESWEDFMIRKIKITTKFFIAKKKLPSPIQFKVKAVIRNSTSTNSQKVQESIEMALLEIKNSLSLQI